MPDSNSPYAAASGTPQVLELLRHQLVSVSEDRRRVMLWSAILAAGLLLLLGRVASIPWFLALAPMLLLALWQACLLVRQRRCQAAWENILQKTENGAGQNSIAKASALAASSAELGARDIPDLLGAIASPSVLIFHGLLLGAVVAGGATHEMSHEPETSTRVAKASTGGSGGGCGCGGGSSASASASGERAVASSPAVPTTRPPNAASTRNFNNVPPRPAQPAAYPTRPMPAPAPTVGQPQPQPGASARTAVMPGTPSAAPIPNPRTASPLPAQNTRTPIPGSSSPPVSPTPAPAPAPAPAPSVSPAPAPTGALPVAQPPQPREDSAASPTPTPLPAKSDGASPPSAPTATPQ